MKMSFFCLVVQGIPEQIAMLTLIVVLAKAKLRKREICFFGAVFAGLLYLMRMLPITFGVHTILSIIIQIFFVISYLGKKIEVAVMSVITAQILLILAEGTVFFTIYSIWGLSPKETMSNKVLNILPGYPHIIILFLASYIVKKYRLGRS